MSSNIPQFGNLQALKTAFKVQGVVQRYAWGKIGQDSRIARFATDISTDEPLAEYWLGVHERGSARLVLPDGSVRELAELFSSEQPLPFLLKILSINQLSGLSIQSHPDKKLASELHRRFPEHYPDDNHKPELGIALSPVEILYGFKSIDAIRALLGKLPMVRDVFSESLNSALAEGLLPHSEDIIKQAFAAVLRADSSLVKRTVHQILATEPGRCIERDIIERIVKQHEESDPGLLSITLMNVVTLSTGQGIFIAPNVPHAYLSGDLIECMACSDNVIRAGLTKKFRDIDTLLDTCSYDVVGPPSLLSGVADASGLHTYPVPVSDFQLGCIPYGGCGSFTDESKHRMLLSVDGASEIKNLDSGVTISLADGEAALVVAGSGSYECHCISGQLFVAS